MKSRLYTTSTSLSQAALQFIMGQTLARKTRPIQRSNRAQPFAHHETYQPS